MRMVCANVFFCVSLRAHTSARVNAHENSRHSFLQIQPEQTIFFFVSWDFFKTPYNGGTSSMAIGIAWGAGVKSRRCGLPDVPTRPTGVKMAESQGEENSHGHPRGKCKMVTNSLYGCEEGNLHLRTSLQQRSQSASSGFGQS